MTSNPSIESAAEAAYLKYRERYHADVGPSAWTELGDAQKDLWRDVARAALCVIDAILASNIDAVRKEMYHDYR